MHGSTMFASYGDQCLLLDTGLTFSPTRPTHLVTVTIIIMCCRHLMPHFCIFTFGFNVNISPFAFVPNPSPSSLKASFSHLHSCFLLAPSRLLHFCPFLPERYHQRTNAFWSFVQVGGK